MLDEYWRRNFDRSQPMAHQLRERYRSRWVRFHSLPNSKRYAETAGEWTTLLERHNDLVDRLATDECRLLLLTTSWSSDRRSFTAPPECVTLDLTATHWQSFAKDGDATNWWHVFQTPIIWKRRTLDSVFRLVADNEISNVMLLDPADDWMIHPYDGGVDLILRSPTERNTIAAERKTWLSARRDGL